MSKRLEFNEAESELAELSRAIGHPARIAIVLAIAQRNNKIEGETIDIHTISRTTVLQHLRELKRAGLVEGRLFGMQSNYSVNLQCIQKFDKLFTDFMTEIDFHKLKNQAKL